MKTELPKLKKARQVECIPPASSFYRYQLTSYLPGDGAALLVIMKNPSTASATRSDATIGKVEAWAKRCNYRSVTIVNLFAYRSPYPTQLNQFEYNFIVGAENDYYIKKAITQAEIVIAAWGNANGIKPEFYNRRIREVLQFLQPVSSKLKVVGELTKQGYPRHARMWNNHPSLQNYVSLE